MNRQRARLQQKLSEVADEKDLIVAKLNELLTSTEAIVAAAVAANTAPNFRVRQKSARAKIDAAEKIIDRIQALLEGEDDCNPSDEDGDLKRSIVRDARVIDCEFSGGERPGDNLESDLIRLSSDEDRTAKDRPLEVDSHAEVPTGVLVKISYDESSTGAAAWAPATSLSPSPVAVRSPSFHSVTSLDTEASLPTYRTEPSHPSPEILKQRSRPETDSFEDSLSTRPPPELKYVSSSSLSINSNQDALFAGNPTPHYFRQHSPKLIRPHPKVHVPSLTSQRFGKSNRSRINQECVVNSFDMNIYDVLNRGYLSDEIKIEHNFVPLEACGIFNLPDCNLPDYLWVTIQGKPGMPSREEISAELSKFYNNFPASGKTIKKSERCAVRDPSGAWYRGKVIGEFPHEAEVAVVLLDIGESRVCPITDVRPLKAEFAEFPCRTLPCRLRGAGPLLNEGFLDWKRYNDTLKQIFDNLKSVPLAAAFKFHPGLDEMIADIKWLAHGDAPEGKVLDKLVDLNLAVAVDDYRFKEIMLTAKDSFCEIHGISASFDRPSPLVSTQDVSAPAEMEPRPVTVVPAFGQERKTFRRDQYVSALQCSRKDLVFVHHGVEFTFQFSFVESPAAFYVRPQSLLDSGDLRNLHLGMRNFYQSVELESFKNDFDPRIHDAVAVFHEESDEFRRGLVRDIRSVKLGQKSVYLVYYLDFGETEWVDWHNAGPLLESFAHLPPQCVKCNLTPDLLPTKRIWSEEDGLAMSRLIDFQVVYKGYLSKINNVVSIDPFHLEALEISVLLPDFSKDGEPQPPSTLADKLIALGVARVKTPPRSDISVGGSSSIKSEIVNSVGPDSVSSIPELPRVVGSDRPSSRGSYNSLDQPALLSLDSTPPNVNTKAVARTRAVFRVKLDVGKWYSVEVVSFVDPDNFYLRFVFGATPLSAFNVIYDDTGIPFAEIPSSDTSSSPEPSSDSTIISLQHDIEEYCLRHEADRLLADFELRADAMAFVRVGESFARCRLCSVDDNSVKVYLVDFGYYRVVRRSAENFIRMDERFAKEPEMAVPCRLARVRPAHWEWSEEAKKWFGSRVNSRSLIAQVVSSSSNNIEVDIWDTSPNDFLINQGLLDLGFALKC